MVLLGDFAIDECCQCEAYVILKQRLWIEMQYHIYAYA